MQLSAPQKADMRQHYEKATRAYDVGKYQEAIEEYQKAYEIGGDPAMLYNIAQAYRLNDQPGEAIRFYRRYLQRQPSARNREDVERKVNDLERVAEERRKTAAAVAAAAPPIPTPPPEVAAPASPPPAVGVSTERPPLEETAGSRRVRRIVGWSLIGAGVAAGGAGGYFALLAKSKADKLSDASRRGDVFDSALERSGKNANLAAMIFGGAGAATVVAGVIVLVTGDSPSEEAAPAQTARAEVFPLLGGGVVGAGAHVRF
jgi:tetratricopeptide (TPR) repeat protein